MAAAQRSAAYVFGTMVELALSGAPAHDARKAAAAVFDDFERLHWKLHAWKAGDLLELNRAIASGAKRLAVDREMAMLISETTRLSVLSRGLFNPAIGRLVALWSFHADEIRPVRPPRRDVRRLVRASPQMTDLVVRGEALECLNPGVQLDFGGYAKGYALDRAARLLQQWRMQGALINIGGHLLALGLCGERPWSVAVRHPRYPGALARLELHNGEALSTSGDYERFFRLGCRRYAHVIDPRTGLPASGVQAAVVLTSSTPGVGALSDAASGALFVAGRQGWRRAARAMGITHAMLVDGQGRLSLTGPMRERLELWSRHR